MSGLAVRRHTLDASDRIHLCGLDRGAGPPLLWAHGLLSSKEATLDTLRDAHHRVVAFDQRGHGESARLKGPEEAGLADFAQDILQILDALGFERIVIGGESMGAAAVLEFAVRNPHRVSALMIDRPAFGAGRDVSALDWAKEADELTSVGIDVWMERSTQGLTLDARTGIKERYQRHWRRHEAASIAAIFRALDHWRIPDAASLATLDVPIVVRAWEGDAVHPFPLAEWLSSVLPQARLVQVERSLHYDAAQDAASVAACLDLLGGLA